MIRIDCFSAGLDDLKRKQQADIACVLRVLEKTRRFSIFEATANDTIAKTMDRVMHDGYVTKTGGAYPWTHVALTDKGLAAIQGEQ